MQTFTILFCLLLLCQCKTMLYSATVPAAPAELAKLRDAKIIQGGVLLQYTSAEDEKELSAINETLTTLWQEEKPKQKSVSNEEFCQHFNEEEKQQIQTEFARYLDFSDKTRQLLQSKLPNLRYIFYLSIETGKERRYEDFLLQQSYNTPTGIVYEEKPIGITERNVRAIPLIYDIQEGKIVAAASYQRMFRRQRMLLKKGESTDEYPSLSFAKVYRTTIQASLEILP
ncbi:MAG: hypothetical protein AAF518_03130 [Spirochaetota bacterium]